ncbi:hypothetical protein HC928_15830, partial [bacterium]|nr:hypothetical protein [bacterium]
MKTESAYLLEFQVNTELSVKALGRKPVLQGEDSDFRYNTTQYWSSEVAPDGETSTHQELKHCIEEGLTVRYGIKRCGNRQEHFVLTTGTALDLDCTSEEQLNQFLNIGMKNFSFYGHPSFSFNGKEKWGYRIHFAFNRTITSYQEAKLINYCLMLEFYPDFINFFQKKAVEFKGLDQSCSDPTRLWYGTNPQHCIDYPQLFYFEDGVTLDVDLLIDGCPDEIRDYVYSNSKVHTPSDEKTWLSENLNQAFTQHLISLNVDIPDFIEKMLDDAGYPVLNWHEHHSAGSALWSYRSSDPFDTQASASSDSFCISLMEDNSLVFRSGKTGHSGDIAKLIQSLEFGNYSEESLNNSYKRMLYNKVLVTNNLPELPEFKGSPQVNEKNGSRDEAANDYPQYFIAGQRVSKEEYPSKLMDAAMDANFFKLVSDGKKLENLTVLHGEFWYFNGSIWERLDSDKNVDELVSLVQRGFKDTHMVYLDGKGNIRDKYLCSRKDEIFEYLYHLKVYLNTKRVDKKMAEQYTVTADNDLGKVSGYLNLENGVLHFDFDNKKVELLEPSPEFGFTFKSKASYNPDDIDTIDESMARHMLTSVREDQLPHMLTLMLGAIDFHKVFSRTNRGKAAIMVGAGSNGKDTLLLAMTKLIGNASKVSLNDYYSATKDNRTFAIYNLTNPLTRWNYCGENSAIPLNLCTKLKEVLDGDSIQIEGKNINAKNYIIEKAQFFAMNETGSLKKLDVSMKTRYAFFPFEKTFVSGEPQNENEIKAIREFSKHKDEADEKFYNNEVLPGLINLIVKRFYEYCDETEENKLNWDVCLPDKITAESTKDHLRNFINQCLELSGSETAGCREVWIRYQLYCISEGWAEAHITTNDGMTRLIEPDNYLEADNQAILANRKNISTIKGYAVKREQNDDTYDKLIIAERLFPGKLQALEPSILVKMDTSGKIVGKNVKYYQGL